MTPREQLLNVRNDPAFRRQWFTVSEWANAIGRGYSATRRALRSLVASGHMVQADDEVDGGTVYRLSP